MIVFSMKLIFLFLTFIYLLVVGMNCSPNSMKGNSSLNASRESDLLAKQADLPLALQNGEQTLTSMLNVAGITQATAGINNEFAIRSTSLSEKSYLTVMNGPLFLSSTSLAGEVCNALIARERPLAQGQRTFFQLTNFAAGPASITDAEYNQTIANLGLSAWGRALSETEKTLFVDFKNDFILSLTAAARTQAAQTNNLYISTCAAVLSSFEFLTF